MVHSHCKGPGPNEKYHVEMFALIWDRDRDQEPLFPSVPVLFPTGTGPGPGPVQCK